MRELIELETKYPEYDDETSPTKKIGGIVLDAFKKHTHTVPMMSLSNIFNKEELKVFYDRIQKVIPNTSFTTELKIDGLAVTRLFMKKVYLKRQLLVVMVWWVKILLKMLRPLKPYHYNYLNL